MLKWNYNRTYSLSFYKKKTRTKRGCNISYNSAYFATLFCPSFFFISAEITFKTICLAGAIFDWNDVYAKTGFYYAMNKILRQKENQFNFSTIIEDVSINDSFQLVQKSKLHFTQNDLELLIYVHCICKDLFVEKTYIHTYNYNYSLEYVEGLEVTIIISTMRNF